MEIKPQFEHFCRICTIEQDVGIMIFGEEGEKMMLPDKITKYLHIEINSEDKLPKMICISCNTRLDSFKSFAEMALESQTKLNNHFIAMKSVITECKNFTKFPGVTQNGTYVILQKEEPNYRDNSSLIEDSEVTEMEVSVDPMMFLDLETEDSRTNDTPNVSECLNTEYPNNFQNKIHPKIETDNQCDSLTIELVDKDISIKQELDKPIKVLPDLKPIKLSKRNNVPDSSKPFVCNQCPRSFLSSIALQNHSWLHMKNKIRDITAGEKVFCPICQKGISTKGNLKVHMHTHRPKGKYGCEICGRIFKTNSNLVRHREYHGGEVHSCEICGRVYPTNSTLRAHSVTHSDARPHKCPLCKKTFKRNQDLKFHINQHTGARPYRCPYCPKAFASSGNCFSHRKRMHPMEVERDRDKSSRANYN